MENDFCKEPFQIFQTCVVTKKFFSEKSTSEILVDLKFLVKIDTFFWVTPSFCSEKEKLIVLHGCLKHCVKVTGFQM